MINKIIYLEAKVHNWLRKEFGKANKCECEMCNHKSHSYNWCLIKGKEYDFKRENFIMMCVSCHRHYDMTDEIRKKMSKNNGRGNLGRKFSKETRKKISESLNGRKLSEETKRKMSISKKEYYKNNKELISGENSSMFGKHHSEETKRKMRKSHKKFSKESKLNMSGENNHMYGTHHSDERKKQISDSLKETWKLRKLGNKKDLS